MRETEMHETDVTKVIEKTPLRRPEEPAEPGPEPEGGGNT